MSARKNNEIDDQRILGRALCNAADALGIRREEIVRIIGREHTGVVRDGINPKSKAGELAQMFIRVYQSLYPLVNGNPKNMKHWVATENRYFGQSPRQMMESCQGLVRVLMYLDATRGKS